MAADPSTRNADEPRREGPIRLLLKGACIGMGDPVPGVSAATLAYITGLYDRVLLAIRRFRAGGWRRNAALLLPIAVGMLAGIFTLATIIEWLLRVHPEASRQAFAGLILGGLWLTVRKEGIVLDRSTLPPLLGTAAVLVVLLGFLPHPGAPTADPIRDPTASQLAFIFGAGILAASGMMVPGLSGALLQILIGSYATYVTAVRELNLPILGLFYAGAILGIAGMANVLGALFERHGRVAHVIIGGLVLGSAVFVWPLEAPWRSQMAGVPVAVLAALVPILLGRIGPASAESSTGDPPRDR